MLAFAVKLHVHLVFAKLLPTTHTPVKQKRMKLRNATHSFFRSQICVHQAIANLVKSFFFFFTWIGYGAQNCFEWSMPTAILKNNPDGILCRLLKPQGPCNTMCEASPAWWGNFPLLPPPSSWAARRVARDVKQALSFLTHQTTKTRLSSSGPLWSSRKAHILPLTGKHLPSSATARVYATALGCCMARRETSREEKQGGRSPRWIRPLPPPPPRVVWPAAGITAGSKKQDKATCRNRKGNLAVAAGDVREGDCFHMHACKANIQSNVRMYVCIYIQTYCSEE